MVENEGPKTDLPEQIRVSIGTAIVLGLISSKMEVAPSTAYLMTYSGGKCSANCSFCPQARGSKSSTEYLSRVSWPSFLLPNVIGGLKRAVENKAIKRVCIQALNYPNVFTHLQMIVAEIKREVIVPISVSCQPLNRKNIELLRKVGVDRLGIALDAASELVFNNVKGSNVGGTYSWKGQFLALENANEVFGKGNVSTHLIVGLGETEQEVVKIIQKCVDMDILPALFAFTPVRGTALEGKRPPSLQSYRRIQLARYLIVNRLATYGNMQFSSAGDIEGFGAKSGLLESALASGEPFRTSGCQECNRPYYNEKPGGPIYNYPYKPNQQEIGEIKRDIGAI